MNCELNLFGKGALGTLANAGIKNASDILAPLVQDDGLASLL
jgi:hypothetical protein